MKTEQSVCETNNDLKAFLRNDTTPYQTCKELSLYSRELILRNETEMLLKLVQFILTIYKFSKSTIVRNAIENVFLFNIGTDIMIGSNRKELLNLLPATFRNMIARQMLTSGI